MPEIRCIKTSVNAFAVGSQGGALDDGRGFELSDGIHMFGGTDNLAVFNQHYRSVDKGVNWTQLTNAPWDARNAMAAYIVGNVGYMVGGNDYTSPLVDSWSYTPGVGWAQIGDNMGTVYGSNRAQFAHCRTATRFLIIGGNAHDNCISSTTLANDSWTVRSTLPAEAQLVTGATACCDPNTNIVYLTGGEGAGGYVTKVWRSVDEGDTWEEVGNLPVAMRGKWPNMAYMESAIAFQCGFNTDLTPSGNQMGLYYTVDGGVTWVEARYAPSARHAGFMYKSTDLKRVYSVTGNFVNDSYFITDLLNQ